jgi:hypothetical protein
LFKSKVPENQERKLGFYSPVSSDSEVLTKTPEEEDWRIETEEERF